MSPFTIEQFVKLALQEDIRDGDHSSLACIAADKQSRARLLVKDEGILAGIEVAIEVFRQVDTSLQVVVLLQDGTPVKHGDVAFTVHGNARSILQAERLVLNIMQRMSGIATVTHKYMDAVKGYPAKVLDTRKTTPLLRYFEKWAVRIGGGQNHRFGLFDMIMIKDNHIDFAGGITPAIKAANEYIRSKQLDLKIEIEARNLDAVKEILAIGGVQRIMLDNFTPAAAKEAVDLIAGQYETEISGGINLDTIASYAASGADYISVGALTHSVKSLDLSLKAY
ncbi:MAG: carboxylating nicotinate-nucleotide diphosphorylase [Chitinophagales bacterium]|nr:carboxylating nicotinate-nucleotide diphosphorylase [Chitinophagales bacterium]